MELIGIFLIASGLLVVAGVAKSIHPDDTGRALAVLASRDATGQHARAVRWRWLVRIGAGGEAALGVVALAIPRPATAALVAASYAAFAVVVIVARRRGGPLATCGCFGQADTPPTLVHLALNVLFSATAVVIAVTSPNGATLLGELSAQPTLGIPLIFVSGVGLWLSVLAVSALGRLEGARRLIRGARPL
jgi:hypothetical protein